MAEGGVTLNSRGTEIYPENHNDKYTSENNNNHDALVGEIDKVDGRDITDVEANLKTVTAKDKCTWCDPCHKRNKYMPANQYCPDCSEYFCVDCGDLHSSFALGRNHTVLTGSDMPNSQAMKPLQYEKCGLHVENHSNQFCTRHRELLCRQCAKDAHSSCEIKTVSEIASDFSKTDICKFKSLLCKTKTEIQSKLSVFEQNVTDVENQRKVIEQKLQFIYDAIIFKVKKMFKDSIDELECVYNKTKTYLLNHISELNQVVLKIESSIQNLENLNQMDVKCFLHLQNIAKLTRADIFKINEYHRSVRSRNIRALVNQNLKDFIDVTPNLGTCEAVMSDYQVTKSLPLVTFPVSMSMESLSDSALPSRSNLKRLEHFSAKLPDDKKDCGIVGIDITSDGRILVADLINMNVKCFDQCGKYDSHLQLEYQPSDLAVVNKDDTIVSLWCQPELYILDTREDGLSMRKRIKVGSPVSAISVHKDKIIVNCREGSGSVKLMDRCGRVYWSRSIDSEENDLFKHPRCNTCFSFKSTFLAIVTDYNKRSITKLSGRTGDVKTVYRLPDEKDPFGVTNDKQGNIYVCYREANEIAIVDVDLEHEKVFLSDKDGLGTWPNCIKYVTSANQLFVCYSGLKESRNYIDCFQI